MYIRIEPKGKIYESLIDLAFEVCDEFVLVIRSEIDVSENAKSVIESLSCYLKYTKEEFEWPGTIYYGEKPARVYYFRTDIQAKEILLRVANGLYDWTQPNLPEDLSFILNNKEWLVNTAHEEVSYIYCDDEEVIQRVFNIEGLSIKR